ncbi:MAG: hypothetical protein AB7P24_00905 [Nitrospira sp.]
MVGQVWQMGRQARLAMVAAGMALLIGFAGCAAERPKVAPSIMKDQVRDHAEQGFDKLNQEEKNRAAGSGENLPH